MPNIHAVPAFRDNYIWALENGRDAVVVDPGEAAPVESFLERHGLKLAAVLATHHHADHVGGLPQLVRRWKCPAYGPAREVAADLDERLGEGDRFTVPGLGIALGVLDIPAHTAGHIAFFGDDAVFCGDTLFACGCGRLFEGTAAQMVDSLGKLARLPGSTRVYCGHEYTLANIRFAEAVEPGNARGASPPCPPRSPMSSRRIRSCAAVSPRSSPPRRSTRAATCEIPSKCSRSCASGKTVSDPLGSSRRRRRAAAPHPRARGV
jgi:hydroxyacylglutathione hydrolase